MIQNILLNAQMIWITFIKILKNTVQIKKRKTLIVVDDMTAHMFSNKRLRGRKLINYLVFITILFCCSKTF